MEAEICPVVCKMVAEVKEEPITIEHVQEKADAVSYYFIIIS